MSVILVRGYTDPLKYVTDLLTVAYEHSTYQFTGAEEDAKQQLATVGVAGVQRAVADDPTAEIPDWMRDVLRDWAAKGGEFLHPEAQAIASRPYQPGALKALGRRLAAENSEQTEGGE